MSRLVMIRHGESVWNSENRFTGWTDVDLSEKGVREAEEAAKLIKSAGYSFDVVHSSLLKRAIRTAWIVLDNLDMMWLPMLKTWRLNERHYGRLQGLNKAETAEKFGADQVKIWRRSYSVRPPALEPSDERHPANDPRYKDFPPRELPACESLEDTLKRVMPYWESAISEDLVNGRDVLICAHGNSIRALVKHLEKLSDEKIISVEIPTGAPLVYEFDSALATGKGRYLK